ncbi:hypothetical protein H9L39_08797 [Fusarium oxysporum f. sp. albedinis]|nr:hypothetical protein H9L39_08797 [Fusarium oxysporum f. sp. albedinis]
MSLRDMRPVYAIGRSLSHDFVSAQGVTLFIKSMCENMIPPKGQQKKKKKKTISSKRPIATTSIASSEHSLG